MAEKNQEEFDDPRGAPALDGNKKIVVRLHQQLVRASNILTALAAGGMVLTSLTLVVSGQAPSPTSTSKSITLTPGNKPQASTLAPSDRPLVRQVPVKTATRPAAPESLPGQLPQPAANGEPTKQSPTSTRLQDNSGTSVAAPPLIEPTNPEANLAASVWSEPEISDALKECVRLLSPVTAEVEPQPPIRNGQCGMPAPLSVRTIGKEAVALESPVIANCAVTAALSKWVDQSLQPAAREAFGSPVVRFIDAGSYSCRNRNNEKSGPISEHAFGNAIDIGGFVLANGRTIRVLDGWGPVARDAKPTTNADKPDVAPATNTDRSIVIAQRPANLGGPIGAVPTPSPIDVLPSGGTPASIFLHRIHGTACKVFWTVLGPEANSEHRNHLHLDMKTRKSQHVCQ